MKPIDSNSSLFNILKCLLVHVRAVMKVCGLFLLPWAVLYSVYLLWPFGCPSTLDMTVFNKAKPRRLSLQHLQQMWSMFGVRGTTQIWGMILIYIGFSSPHSDGTGQKKYSSNPASTSTGWRKCLWIRMPWLKYLWIENDSYTGIG